MVLANYHTHTKFCDGVEEPKLYALEAINKSLWVLGFSAHAPLPFHCSWTLPFENYQAYLHRINELKIEFADQLEILCGLEIDYIPNLWPQIKSMLNPDQLDYYIGSIHFVDCFEDGTPWSVDGSHEEFYQGWEEIFKRDSHSLVRNYFEYTRQMVRVMKPPIIGHLDKIKMQYRPNCFIPETDPLYRKELMNTLEEIAFAGSIVEINTRGVYRRGELEFYPSKWVLQKMLKLKIPVMINSDAHRPNEVSLLYPEAIIQLKQVGYKKVMYFSDQTWLENVI